jgi:hypothetical protein
MRKKYLVLVLTITCISAAAQSDVAPSPKKKRQPPTYTERLRISAGLFAAVNNTIVKVDGANGQVGTTINFQKDLGFTQSTATFLGDIGWRASRRSSFSLNFFHINRTSTHILQKDINFGDSTYFTNSRVQGFFNTDIYQLSYGYSVLLRPRYEAGFAIGIHVVGAKSGLALATTRGELSREQNFGFTGLLPDLNVWGSYGIAKNWVINGSFGYLALGIDSTWGRILTFNTIITYHFAGRFSASVGYTGLNFKIEATRRIGKGDLEWGYNGPALTLNYSFGNKNW